MATRLYLVPITGAGTRTDPRAPKYFRDGTIPTVAVLTAAPYGFEPWVVVTADLPDDDRETVVAKSDAFLIPADLDVTLSTGAVISVSNKLEAINIPAGWVNTTLTWRDVMRTVLWMSAFMQRFTALNVSRLFTGGVTLTSTVASLPAPVRANLAQAVTDLGLAAAGVTGGTTLRAGLKALAVQSQDRPYILGALTI